MKKRLFIYTTLIISAGLLCFFAVSVSITQGNNLNMAKSTVMEAARICAGLYSDDVDLDAFVKAGDETRITVISQDGTVLADSFPLDMGSLENHLARPEVRDAANGSPTAHVRHSETLGIDFIYYALKVEAADGHVFIRAAVPVALINAYLLRMLPPLVILLFAVALLCLALSRSVIRRIIKPFESVECRLRMLAGGEYEPEPIAGNYAEIETLIRSIDEVTEMLQKSFEELRNEKTKLDYVMGNIGDGLVVLDDNGDVALINPAARGIFNVTPEIMGKSMNYLTSERALLETVRSSMNHYEDALLEIVIDGRIFLVAVKRVPDTRMTLVVLSDVTENRENAKRREEFFTNASHELKTPLTAIKGFNELTAINNKDEGIVKYIESIARETDRMLSLIVDMLKLSELEGTQDVNPVPVSLSKAAGEVSDNLTGILTEKSVSLEIVGDGEVAAEQGHVYELVKNLVENAVRYSNQGGKVSVIIDCEKGETSLYVFDEGIGISPEEQTRIFERFYRVERSRSQRSGGTGLGLSIVKHICALYGWKLSLKSRLGVGTEITVAFGEQ